MTRREFYERWYARQERLDRITLAVVRGRILLEQMKANIAAIAEWFKKKQEDQ